MTTARHGPADGGPRPSIVVIGGGLAGIAAAVRLARAGLAITLIETSKRLGGRATSFVDPTTGRLLDNCQHVVMGCCTNLLDLYDKLNVAHHIRWQRRLFFAGTDRKGRPVIDTLEGDDLPPPLHLAASLLRFRLLTMGEKLAIARAMTVMMRLGTNARASLHGVSFADWLASQRQPHGAVEKFWSVVIVSALNEQIDRAAADLAVQVFQEGFLAHEDAYVMGLPAVPLVQLYDAAQPVIEAAGGRVRLATGAESFHFDGQRIVSLQLSDGSCLSADAFISALPHDRLAKICPAPMVEVDNRLGCLMRFRFSPILGIHMWFATDHGAPAMRLPHLVLTRSPLQWVFNKGFEAPDAQEDAQKAATTNGGEQVQHLHGVISAAHDLVDSPAQNITDMAVAEVHNVLRGSVQTRLVHARVIKEKRATFSAAPGVDALRPGTRGAIQNLYLAGDWCASGWPATMEGAVRSGYAAAAVITEAQQRGETLVPDLAPGPLITLLRGRS